MSWDKGSSPTVCLYSWIQLCLNTTSSGLATLSTSVRLHLTSGPLTAWVRASPHMDEPHLLALISLSGTLLGNLLSLRALTVPTH